MRDPTPCEGCPRDLGLDQGRAHRGGVRDALARAGVRVRHRFTGLRPLTRGWVLGQGVGREVIRHDTHLAERIAGIALGADLSLEALMVLHIEKPGALAAPAVAVSLRGAEGSAGGALVARALPPASWILRRSRPEVGFASVEVTLPWLASSVAGVNDRGLAAALAVGVGPDDAGSTAPLLVQECLQRFEHLDAALDWCLKRPVSGTGCVILSDASGESAAVEIGAVYRRVRRPAEGILVAGDGSERAAQVRKALGLGRDLEAALGPCVSLDPAAHSLAILRDGSARVDVCA